MERRIVSFHQDTLGDWIADLDCGHVRHVRHAPPLSTHAWVESEEGRRSHLGCVLDCPECDRPGGPESPTQARLLQVAAAVRFECLAAAREGYEQATMSGLCHEGALDVAMDRIRALDLEAVLASLPG